MKIEIFVAVSGGCVQGVRAKQTKIASSAGLFKCYLVDYDNHECDLKQDGQTEEEFERIALNGRTWAEIEIDSVAIF